MYRAAVERVALKQTEPSATSLGRALPSEDGAALSILKLVRVATRGFARSGRRQANPLFQYEMTFTINLTLCSSWWALSQDAHNPKFENFVHGKRDVWQSNQPQSFIERT